MRFLAAIALASVVMVGGCSQDPTQSEPTSSYDQAMAKCIVMASEAMPKGMQDPDDPTAVLDSEQFCIQLASGYSREKFAELYNDPEWLASELQIWSDEGLR